MKSVTFHWRATISGNLCKNFEIFTKEWQWMPVKIKNSEKDSTNNESPPSLPKIQSCRRTFRSIIWGCSPGLLGNAYGRSGGNRGSYVPPGNRGNHSSSNVGKGDNHSQSEKIDREPAARLRGAGWSSKKGRASTVVKP